MNKNNILKAVVICAIALTSIESFAVDNNPTIMSIKHDDTVTKTFKVYGNCGMCKKTIEGALTNIKGIVKADWNKETKIMEATFHEHEITLDEIKKKIAAVGYDTDKFRATDKAYNNLAGCCQYERPAEKKSHDNHDGHSH